MFNQGEYSCGQSLEANIPSDLCVPIGLILPDSYEFIVNDEKETDPTSVVPIHDKKMDHLLDLVSLKSQNHNRKTKKNRKPIKRSKSPRSIFFWK